MTAIAPSHLSISLDLVLKFLQIEEYSYSRINMMGKTDKFLVFSVRIKKKDEEEIQNTHIVILNFYLNNKIIKNKRLKKKKI